MDEIRKKVYEAAKEGKLEPTKNPMEENSLQKAKKEGEKNEALKNQLKEVRPKIRRKYRRSRYGQVIGDKIIGRNEPCPCASGKKYKRCCGR